MGQSDRLDQGFVPIDATYDSAYWELYAQMFSSGAALTLLDTISATIPASGTLSTADIASTTAAVRTCVENRSQALKDALAGQ
ncbi:hypothetical protein ACQCSX_02515 [Pseudarthrobacter sp. P1]|uniref:hypothetical protein n=1 Tax=Pseudarthrobacter sp. P1 TaxID=3418418 RepID=UPI003CEF1B5F